MTTAALFAVALGGAAGAVCRVGLASLGGEGLPWPTLVVNVVGSLVIGLFVGFEALHAGVIPPALRAGLIGGFCGAFTTFSTFSQQTVALAQAGMVFAAAGNAMLNLFGSLLATVAGLWLATRWHSG